VILLNGLDRLGPSETAAKAITILSGVELGDVNATHQPCRKIAG